MATNSDYTKSYEQVVGAFSSNPSNNLFQEPPSPASVDNPPLYPYNQTWDSEGAHSIQLDDTPGRERVRIQHGKSRNFIEMHPDGNQVIKVFGEGFDITISMLRDKSKDSKVGFTKVSSVIPDRESKLSDDENQSVEWLSDPMAWTDVFKKKSIEYLNIVAEGSEPIWDAEQKCFISKVEDGVSTYTGASAPTPKAKYETPAPVAMSEEDTDVDGVVEESAPAGQLKIDDLPF
jgi:hypothetical protein